MVGKGRKRLLAGKTTAAAAVAKANKEKDNKKMPISRSYRVGLQINSMSTVPRFVKNSLEDDISSSKASLSSWSSINEPVGISSKKAFMKLRLLEQINTKTDKSDYMWYSLSTEVKGHVPFLEDGSQTVLHVQSIGHVLYSFVNGKLAENISRFINAGGEAIREVRDSSINIIPD